MCYEGDGVSLDVVMFFALRIVLGMFQIGLNFKKKQDLILDRNTPRRMCTSGEIIIRPIGFVPLRYILNILYKRKVGIEFACRG